MIITEPMTINGKSFVRTFSDSGYMVERDGVLYDEAIDPANFNRQYTETDVHVEGYTVEASETDYQNALRDMGVKV